MSKNTGETNAEGKGPTEFGSQQSPDVIETVDAAEPESFEEAVADVGEGSMLGYRLTQQAILSDFGLRALQQASLDLLLDDAARCASEGMRTSLAKILEFRPEEKDLLIRAGVGWRTGVVGKVAIGADHESPAGFAFQSGSAVISNHLEHEDRFRTPSVMAEHGVRRAINVVIARIGGPWGVLEVDSSNAGKFEAADLAFLQGLANLIGVASDRIAVEEQLRNALEHQQLLVKEASHRMKNSLAMLCSLMQMQARNVQTDEAAQALGEASDRILAIAATHDHVWRQDQSEAVDLAALLPSLCDQLAVQSPGVTIRCSAETFLVPTESATSLALLAAEVVTNAVKYAYPKGQNGVIEVVLNCQKTTATLTIKDDGVGLPADFEARYAKSTSLGMRLIKTLSASVGDEAQFSSHEGTSVVISGIRSTEY
jgi:two-component sensor histidine kinase